MVDMVEVDESFPTRLRALLSDRRLSQTELARQTDIARWRLSKIVNGKRRPNAREIGALAHALEVDMCELIGVAVALDKFAEMERRTEAAEERAAEAKRAYSAEAATRSRVEAQHAERIAELERDLGGLADARDASERDCAALREQLEEAQGLIELLRVIDSDFSEPKASAQRERPWVVPAVVEDRYAPARKQADLWGNFVGGAVKVLTSLVVYGFVSKRLDG